MLTDIVNFFKKTQQWMSNLFIKL